METSEMRRKSALVGIVVCFYLLTTIKAHVVTPLAEDSTNRTLNITSHADDFVIYHQRQYAAKIQTMASQLDAFQSSYEKQLALIRQQSELLESKVLEMDTQLMPLEMLSDVSKHCVQKYRKEITTITVSTVKTAISECVGTASDAYNRLVSDATDLKNDLELWLNKELFARIEDCKNKEFESHLNYTLCVTEAIDKANCVTATDQKSFNKHMKEAICAGELRTSESLDCAFSIVTDTMSQIGIMNRLIDNCIEGKDVCPVCPNLPDPSNYCEKRISVNYNPTELFSNITIANFLRGQSPLTPCVILDFSYNGP